MNPAEWLVRSAMRSPGMPALLRGAKVIADYSEFARRAAAIGGALAARGVKPGDRVAVFMSNRTEYLEVLYGIWFAGAAVVPINAKLHPRECGWIVENAGAEVVFVSPDVGAGLRAVLPKAVRVLIEVDGPEFDRLYQAEQLGSPVPLRTDDLAWLFYTSGTTGKPKGVMLTCGNLQAATFSYFVDVDEVSRHDAALYAAPISHGAGLYNFMHVLRGARHVIPESGGFDPNEILTLAPQLGNVHLFAAPTMVRRLIDCAKQQGSRGEGIRTVVYGGGPMYLADVVDAVEVMGSKFVQIYGQGESPMTITALSRQLVADRTHPRWKQRLGSVGIAQSCVRVKIADQNGNELAASEIGEILVQGTPVMPGYWQNAEADRGALRNGWLWTGDIGAMDEDGFVTLHDRSKDVIISGGTNIYPREVEEVLLLHPSVHEAAVVGRGHPEWGEEVVAFLVPAEDETIDKAQLDEHCLDQIARFKRPKAYFIEDALPKNNYGKVLKTALRERCERQE